MTSRVQETYSYTRSVQKCPSFKAHCGRSGCHEKGRREIEIETEMGYDWDLFEIDDQV